MKMGFRTYWAVLLLAGVSVLGVACHQKDSVTLASGAAPAVDDKSGVCIYDGLAIRSTAAKTGKYVTSIMLGESVKCSGESNKDETGREFVKVELSDGKSGWASSFGIVPGAAIAAMSEDAVVYKRPDMLTATNQKIPFMTIIAVTQTKDDWVEATSEGKKLVGWVRKSSVALGKEDVMVAILATKKLREKDGLDHAQKIEAIVNNSPYPASAFIKKLKDQAVEQPSSAAGDAVKASATGNNS
jgi:hypothetical protein